MRIKSLSLTNFMSHDSTTVEFPSTGVVLVTGKNGAGKTALSEAVAWAIGGETLRKKPPFRVDVSAASPCVVQLKAEGLSIERARKGSTTSLKWHEVDGEAAAFATTTKAQSEVETRIGTLEAWRAAHVFSSLDAARFTLATDKERKLLVEGMALDGAKFDAALLRCRAEQKRVAKEVADITSRLAVAKERLDSARQREEAAKRMLAGLPESVPVGDASKVSRLKGFEKVVLDEVQDMRAEVLKLRQKAGRQDGELAVLERQLHRLDKGTCDTCGQPVPVSQLEGIRTEISKRKAAAAEVAQQAEAEAVGYVASTRDAEERLQTLRTQIATLEAELRRSREVSTARATNEAEVAKAALAVAAAQEVLATAQDALPSLTKQAQLLDAAEVVLGLKGVRNALLARTLKAIELAINAWLPRLAGRHLKVRLTATKETKTGTISDSIGFEVEGAGGGYGYQASSGGERRRIDISVLLALGDIACTARGKTPGTLFLDEVLDALDDEGVEAVAQVLNELGKERAVVVVSHNSELAERLPQAVKWHVVGGHIQ